MPCNVSTCALNTADKKASVSTTIFATDTVTRHMNRKLYKKNSFSHCISQNLTDRDYRNIQGILPDLMLDCSLPPGQPSNSLDGYRYLGELKALLQRNMSVEKRAEHIQLDLEQNAKDFDARDPRNAVHAEMKDYGPEGQYIALVMLAAVASSPGTLSR